MGIGGFILESTGDRLQGSLSGRGQEVGSRSAAFRRRLPILKPVATDVSRWTCLEFTALPRGLASPQVRSRRQQSAGYLRRELSTAFRRWLRGEFCVICVICGLFHLRAPRVFLRRDLRSCVG